MSEAGAYQRLCLTSLSHVTDRRLRRILALAGYDLRFGWPRAGDGIAVWGHRPTAKRGEALAARTDAPLIRIEDAFLRSIHPGRAGEPPIGLILDKRGIYYDARQPSDLEVLLTEHPLDQTDLLNRARAGIHALRTEHISKYNAFDPTAALPDPGYVLVIDQARDDASIRLGGANALHFAEMLTEAQLEHPNARIVIKGHPETRAGFRKGYFGPEDAQGRISYLSDPVSPWGLLEGAVAVYVVTSQLGFEAVLTGHRPQVFGQPFYAGWGLTEDRIDVPRRARVLTKVQLFAGAMLLYPTWYDPARDRLGTFEDSFRALSASARAWREDKQGSVALGMRLWKRGHLRRVFGPITFDDKRAVETAQAQGQPLMVWAGKVTDGLVRDAAVANVPLHRVEDGFLRSKGLGAALVAPLSLVRDRTGIYYDPNAPSDLEQAISQAAKPPPEALNRARALRERIVELGLSKYNLTTAACLPDVAAGRTVILVPGQVEDDASIRLGAGKIRRNADLLAAARAAHPNAYVIYKPHPDVEAGLRPGKLSVPDEAPADHIARHSDPTALLAITTRVWTMTSALGFEALMREVPVTTLGTPFYAGWGLTEDRDLHAEAALRRTTQPSLDALVHAALITYPRYFDPVTKSPCSPEVIVDLLASGALPPPAPGHRMLSKLQGIFASQSWLWR
ncbi:MAG: capsular polysaccharide export protein [Dinoroseobacter sp.]|jgi:capsular polysaccharide export protein